ncbi:MAG: chemotaxis protein CheW [Pseudomonadota bacterium]
MEEQDHSSNEPVTEWVTFRLEDEKYGVNVMLVREVLKNVDLAPVPGSPPFVLGIINLRGNVVTVVDTRKRFGLSVKEPDEATRIVVIEMGEQVLGMMVDSVAEVATLSASDIEYAPNVGNDESAQFIQGVSNQGDELLILVDMDKLFSHEELTGEAEE